MEQLRKSSWALQVFLEAVVIILVKLCGGKGLKKVKTHEKLVTTKVWAHKKSSTIKVLNWQGFTFGQKIKFAYVGTTREKKCNGIQNCYYIKNGNVQKCKPLKPHQGPSFKYEFCHLVTSY